MGAIGNYSRTFCLKVTLLFTIFGIFTLSSTSSLAEEFTSDYSDIPNQSNNYFLNPTSLQSKIATSAVPSVAFGPPDTADRQSAGLPQSAVMALDPELEAQRIKRQKLKTIYRLEVAYQLLGALDAAQTISCMKKPNCQEANPLLGKRPSVGEIVGFKLASGLLHYAVMRHEVKRDRLRRALTFEIISVSVQGVVCGLNFRNAF